MRGVEAGRRLTPLKEADHRQGVDEEEEESRIENLTGSRVEGIREAASVYTVSVRVVDPEVLNQIRRTST